MEFKYLREDLTRGRRECTARRKCPCPHVYSSTGDTSIVQGYLLEPEALKEVAPAKDETAVRVPNDILLKASEALSRVPLSEDEFDQAFTSCQRTAFRLETLSEYKVEGEEEAFREFCETGVLPESVRKGEWLEEIRETTRKGIRNIRVHVLEYPLSRYLEFEIASYHESIKAGEEVWIADRGMHSALRSLNEDFWLFDGEGLDEAGDLLLLRYGEDGRYLGVDRSLSRETLKRCKVQKDLALALALPFREYVETHGLRLSAAV